MKKATLCFLIKDEKVLLAMKKRGFGVGLWNGVGGKVNPGETIKQAAIREANEEIGVGVSKLKKMADINFYFPCKPEWDQNVTVYLAEKWIGKPKETEEMRPKWFDASKLPFRKMWWDDEFWLPLVLRGKKVRASFTFDKNKKVVKQDLKVSS